MIYKIEPTIDQYFYLAKEIHRSSLRVSKFTRSAKKCAEENNFKGGISLICKIAAETIYITALITRFNELNKPKHTFHHMLALPMPEERILN